MTSERASELQTRIAKEALALMVIHGDFVSKTSEDADISVSHFEEAITLIGKAWELPSEVTDGNLTLIQQERDVLRRLSAGENVDHILPEQELPMNATGTETLDNVWDLFETAVQLNAPEQREALFHLASELAECQNLLDWIEKTPAERELPEVAIG